MIRTQISLDRALYETSRREAARAGISFAELVRRSLRDALPDASEKPWMAFAGVLEVRERDR